MFHKMTKQNQDACLFFFVLSCLHQKERKSEMTVCQHRFVIMFLCSIYLLLIIFTFACFNCIVRKGFRHLEKKRRWNKSDWNRWLIKGCSGEETRGLKVQIQSICECIRIKPQACSVAFPLSKRFNVCMLSIYTCVCVLVTFFCVCTCSSLCWIPSLPFFRPRALHYYTFETI